MKSAAALRPKCRKCGTAIEYAWIDGPDGVQCYDCWPGRGLIYRGAPA